MPELRVVRSELILGGQRSGKSARAESLAAAWLAQSAQHRAVYIATAQAWDDEMRERIAHHRQRRAERVPRMLTVEEPVELAQAIGQHSRSDTLIVVDCLTLWLTARLMPGAGLASPRPNPPPEGERRKAGTADPHPSPLPEGEGTNAGGSSLPEGEARKAGTADPHPEPLLEGEGMHAGTTTPHPSPLPEGEGMNPEGGSLPVGEGMNPAGGSLPVGEGMNIEGGSLPEGEGMYSSLSLWERAGVRAPAATIADALGCCAGPIVLISNEIGLGIFPTARELRTFIDALGGLNQQAAAACERVTLMSAGLPLTLKGSS